MKIIIILAYSGLLLKH